MKIQERRETIEVFKKYIKYLENNLEYNKNFLCYIGIHVSVYDSNGIYKLCGFNNRMLPNAIEYLKSQRPSKTLNKIIYEKPYFIKNIINNNSVWWYYGSNELNISVNMEKIQFLKHLINKLKK